MAFKLKTTRPLGTSKYATPASTLIGVGYPLKVSSNAFAVATAGGKIWALAQGSKASSDSATTAIEGMKVSSRDEFIADVGTGTMASSYIGSTCDLKSGATSNIDLGTDSSHDVTILGWDGVDTTKAYVKFNNALY